MNAIIIDDEIKVRNTIKALLTVNFPEITLLASEGTIEDGYKAIIRYNPELVFLDIELPDGTGFDLLKKFVQIPFRIIFVTGHNEYAIDAIKVSALDYILKPLDTEELTNAVFKARAIISNEEQQLKFQALNENLQSRKILKKLILHTSDHFQLVSLSDIIRAEADSNYTRFFLSDNRKIMVSRTIKEFEALLSSSGLIRVHQSHIVNLGFVDKFFKKDGGYLLLKDGVKIPVSPNMKKQVLQAIHAHLYE
ncbi:MAG TPA: DNA-binding response regulator [Bacteroidales bacterium]|jgi:two-component system, LytTR family, response regulator|nr:DNA-binding response regulator [Bacteroidales bacterium]HBZ22120.1 DNA-binding response regulator [Bacteroidales bacterium]